MKNIDPTEYAIKDIAAPFIAFRGTLGACVRYARGLAMCVIYHDEAAGWRLVAVRYWSKFEPGRNVRMVSV